MEQFHSSSEKWWCYVCGKLIEEDFCLCSMKNSTDRVFLSCNKCYEKFEDDVIVIKVRRVDEEKL